jgi:DNA polymerase-3 subunit delta'
MSAEDTYVGHDEPWRAWRSALAGARMHHGWILAGKKGVGKMPFALAAARELVAEPGVPQPPGEHPDIIVLSHLPANADEEKKRAEGKPYQTKRSIAVEQVREMQQRLVTRPTLGSRRAIVIDPADDLEKPAANALLKSLEEPPAGTYFLLVSHRPGRLIATIRSRCRMLRFPAVPDGEIDAVLKRETPNADESARQAAIAAARGSPGAAIAFVEQQLGPLHALMRRIVAEGDPGFELRGELAAAMGARPDRERQLAALELARGVIADALTRAGPGGIPGIVEAHAELVRLSVQAPTYNFDPGLLVMEIGGLLARAAGSTEPAHG